MPPSAVLHMLHGFNHAAARPVGGHLPQGKGLVQLQPRPVGVSWPQPPPGPRVQGVADAAGHHQQVSLAQLRPCLNTLSRAMSGRTPRQTGGRRGGLVTWPKSDQVPLYTISGQLGSVSGGLGPFFGGF